MVQQLQLLEKQCVRVMTETETGFFSRVFLVPKRSGGWRLVIDLSVLNEFLVQRTFEMDTLVKVKRALRPGMWVTSLDLSDAYHHIPIKQSDQKFLCFQVDGIRYMYMVLPFGLTTAPWAFTEVVKQIKKWTIPRRYVLFQYLDDWLNAHLNRSVLVRKTDALVQLCLRLGLLVNEKKSELVPSQSIVFLGERLDLVAGKAFPTQERADGIRMTIGRILADGEVPFRKAESLLGTLVATTPTVPLGRLNLRPLQQQVIQRVKKGRLGTQRIPVSGVLEQSLKWWTSEEALQTGSVFHPPSPLHTIFTDASLEGWGVAFQGQSWQGKWQRSDRHINWLELRTVLTAIQLLQFRIKGLCVLVLVDNTTAVAYLRNQDGTRSRSLSKLSRRILLLAHSLQITLVPRHITGQLNVLADLASRVDQVVPSEWALTSEAFSWVVRQSPWGPPEVDLFANANNHRLEMYMSPCPDEKAIGVDALHCRWPEKILYAYPPTCILPDVLSRMQSEAQFRILLVLPWSPLAKWIQTLNSLPRRLVRQFPRLPVLVRQPHWDHVHPDPQALNLQLWCLEKTG